MTMKGLGVISSISQIYAVDGPELMYSGLLLMTWHGDKWLILGLMREKQLRR
jgi:hypothetical protein